jgi:hypothetical protein
LLKAECNPNAATNWEYMIAHSAAEDSGLKLTNKGTSDSDDNVHVYLGCRPNVALDSFWRFKSYADPDNFGPPSNFLRIIMLDSVGHWTLSDLPLSLTLEEYMMGGWNHLSYAMSPSGWVVTLDGEVVPDDVYGVFGHVDNVSPDNMGNPRPSAASTSWSPFLGFGNAPLYLGSRITTGD